MACFGLLIAGVQSDPENIWSYLRSLLSHTGAVTHQEDWGAVGKVREVVLETDGLGKLRDGFGRAFYNSMRLRLGKEDPGSSGMLRKGC